MGKVNWTIVAISAGVTLGAGVAVLGNAESPAPTKGGIIVPQAGGAAEQEVRPPVRQSVPDLVTPSVVEVVSVTPAGYTPSLVTPAEGVPVAVPKAPAPRALRVQAAVRPGQLVNKTVNRVTSLTPLTRNIGGLVPNLSGFGWFVDASVSPTISNTTLRVSSYDGDRDRSGSTSTYSGRHRSDRDGR